MVGVWQNGLIVARDGALRAVGPSQTHHNLYPLQARLIQGEPLRVVAERVEMRGHTLRWLLCVFHAMTAGDFRSRRRNVSGQGGG